MNRVLDDVQGRHEFTKTKLDAIGDYLPEMRRSLSLIKAFSAPTRRFAFAPGLVAQIVGDLWRYGIRKVWRIPSSSR